MNIEEVLKQHQQLLEKANASLAAKEAPVKDLSLPPEMRRRRIDEITKQIQDLSAQKDAAVRVYDAAIARSWEQIRRLETELSVDERVEAAGDGDTQPGWPWWFGRRKRRT